jgi:hypothetical protein
MGEHGGLGDAGAAARVAEHPRRVGLQLQRGQRDVRLCVPLGEGALAGVRQGQPVPHEGRARAHRVHGGAQLGAEDEDGGLRVGEQGGELRGAEAPVERLEDGAQLRAGEEQVQVLHAVVREHGDAVAPAHAQRVVQEGGGAGGGAVPLAVGDAALAVVGVDEGDVLGVERGAPGQPVMDDGHGPAR